MKKRLLSMVIMLLFLLGNVSAILPYKESLDIKDLRISKVQCSDNKLNVLAENKEAGNIKLLFKVYSGKGNINVFSNELLKRLEARYVLITTNLACSDLLKLEINGYIDLSNEEKIVYLNSETSYQFTGNEETITNDIMQPTAETQAAQSAQQILKNSYIYFGSKLLVSLDASNNPSYYAQDHIGSNVIITDNNGNLISKQQFEPFGNEIRLNGYTAGTRFKFTGKEQDSSNLYYYGARYYSAGTGRFISVDPIFNPSESSYAYVNNNPINKVDPDGKVAFLAPLIAGAITAAPAVARWAQGIATDPSNMIDMQDLREGWNNKNYWIAGFALLGLASAGGSGREMREGAEVLTDVFKGPRKYYINKLGKEVDSIYNIVHKTNLDDVNIAKLENGILMSNGVAAEGTYLYAIMPGGELRIASRSPGLKGREWLYHSEIVGGGAVIGAGELRVIEGKLLEVNPFSGHYVDLTSEQTEWAYSMQSLREFYRAAYSNGGIKLAEENLPRTAVNNRWESFYPRTRIVFDK